MKVKANENGMGLTAGKEYEVLDKSAGYYKVMLDNGNISYRRSDLFSELDRQQDNKQVGQNVRVKYIIMGLWV